MVCVCVCVCDAGNEDNSFAIKLPKADSLVDYMMDSSTESYNNNNNDFSADVSSTRKHLLSFPGQKSLSYGAALALRAHCALLFRTGSP